MWIVRAFSSTFFLTAIVVSIPLGFDVGGRTCGVAFSLSLVLFYFFLSLLRLTTPHRSWVRNSVIYLVRALQWLIIPALLILCLNRFSDAENPTGWVERTFSRKRAEDTSIPEWLFGHGGLLEAVTVGTWEKVLGWSTPFFQLAEGFCSLLVIQAAGQITRYLVNNGGRSDSWMVSYVCARPRSLLIRQIALLVMSGSIISSSIYFLWRVLQFPEISNVDSALIGVAITCAVILCAWGIGSGRGNPVESSLLFAYIVLCIYQIFTDYQPSRPVPVEPASTQTADFPPLPPIIMASYTTLMHALSVFPSIIQAALNVFTAVFSAISPSVLISLTYRVFVFYASTRIIPAVRESGARAFSQEASLEDSDGAGQFLALLSWFSPSILVAVYTSLLLQHFASASNAVVGSGLWWINQGDGGGILWRWINLAGTMALYAVELWLGKQDDMEPVVAGHWKTE